MSPAYKVEVVFIQELAHCVGTKDEGDTPIILTPAMNPSLRISPEKVTQKALFWHLTRPLNSLNLVQALQVWGEPSMHTYDLAIHSCSHRQAVERVSENLP